MSDEEQNRTARRLLSAADVRRVDAAAAALNPAPGLAALMARAGQAVASIAEARYGGRDGAAVILAGPGMNGGDGAVAARLLKEGWRETRLILLGEPEPGGIAAEALTAYRAAGGTVLSAEDPAAESLLGDAAFIVDALFGVGLTRPLAGAAAALVEAANRASAGPAGPPIFSVDIPSGVATDTGRALGAAIQASATVSFIAPKRGHRLGEGALLAGELLVADIGAPKAALTGWTEDVFENAPAHFPQGFAKALTAHKYDHGSALIAAGGFGATGAARLAARGALRIGAGLVTIAAPEAAMPECAGQLTAIMLRQAETAQAFAALLEDPRINAALIGPGHAVHPGGAARTRAFVETVFSSERCRQGRRGVVLDADALTAWTAPDRLFEMLAPAPCVLTPHAGEFARLFPEEAARLNAAERAATFGKIEACRRAADRSGAVVLLKGFDTVIAAPEGRVAVQGGVGTHAAPWLATAGSGDVLAGFITGLLARGFSPFEAACGGASAHLQAGKAAGSHAIAEDLPDALRGLRL